MDILCVLRLARKVQPASVSVTVGGTRASFPWVNHFRNRNVVQYTRAVNTPVSNPWFYLTPGDANTIPGTLSCILTCSLVSEKLNYILVKPVANHYRYFWTVKKKKKIRLVFGYKLPLVRLVPPKVLQKNYLLQNLHLKSAWNVVYQDFSGVSCFPPDFSHQFLPSSDCRMMLVQKCFDIKRFFSFLNSFYLRSKLLKGFVFKCNIDEL